jgi:hypothetical protein
VFVCYARQPVVGTLLWSSVVSDTSVVNYSNVALFLTDLPSVHRPLSIAGGAAWALIASFLSTVPCEVTGLSTKETCEDFPLSIHGSSWVSPFSTSSYSLFISVSFWEEIFCFGYASAHSSWGGIHCIWIPLRVSPLAIEWFPGSSSGWRPLCFEMIGPVPHMNIDPLLVDGR